MVLKELGGGKDLELIMNIFQFFKRQKTSVF